MSEIGQLSQHLDELRSRIIRVIISIGIITVFLLSCGIEQGQLGDVTVYYPTVSPLDNTAAQITDYMRLNLVPEGVDLIQTAPGQAFFAQIYIAALAGIILSMPVIVRESVGFLKPALQEREIKIGRRIMIPAIALFAAGCAFSYLAVVPYVLDFLYQYGDSAGLITFLNVMDFVSFVLQFLLAFGISFQLPLVMYAASASGLTDRTFWRKNIRYAVIVLVIFGAIITPDGSGVTMWFIAGPMIGLYLAGMVLIERSRDTVNNT